MTVTIWHNPRCSKSRQTLELIRSRGVEPVIVEYLKTPPDEAALRGVLAALRLAPRDLLRRSEPACKARGLADPSRSDAEIIAAMAADPMLIERPVVICGSRAAIGRPPEAVLAIL
ncbi:arsenate reductase [Tepidamorphus gemmatus]|jgi:arsenate reductase|uniref:Arsenate reductase n=1 Tax=Tepidamorphus gemmatus TaxID=747076 RepID=A0A4R3MLB5_9HYPH|nr:arsenate reductase (glutaredoxin) [Tepidamorphus gemmatus]TCT13220.1 arsenate reductase [Tepidamorphus gemmatus]